MKEKLLKVKEQIMQNKKKAAAIGIAVLLLIGAGGYGIVALNMDNKETAKAGLVSGKTKTTVKKTDKKDVTDKKIITDKKTEDKKSSNDKKEVKNEVEKKEDKKEAAKGNSEKPLDKSSTDTTSTGSTGNSNAGNNSSQGSGTVTQPSTPKPEPPAHTHNYSIPMYTSKSIYIVDSEAWTETVNEPIYEMVEHTICSTCKADISGNAGQHLDETMHAGYFSEWRQEQTGTNTYTIEHPEVGHYETEQVLTGYKCSCGAVQ